MNLPRLYIMDTSEIINLIRHYHEFIFKTLYANIYRLLRQKRMIMPRPVYFEISPRHDDVYDWCSSHFDKFSPQNADAVARLPKLIRENPAKFDSQTPYQESSIRNEIDPDGADINVDLYLIALALHYKEEHSDLCPTIITAESRDGGKTKIPVIAMNNDVSSAHLQDMFRYEGWQF